MDSIFHLLHDLNPRAVWPGLLVILIAAAAALALRVIRPATGSVWAVGLTRLGVGIILLAVVLQLVMAGAYLLYPSYLDHAEATVIAVSWLGWLGGPLYPSFDTGDVYGVLYGPVLLQANGFVLWLLGPSVMASKILGLGAFVTAQILAFVVLRRSGAGVGEALAITGVQCLVQSSFAEQAYSFGARGDSMLFLAGEVSVLGAISRPRNATAALLGLAAGIAVNLKLHGALYVLPPLVYFLAQAGSNAVRGRLTAVFAATAMMTLIVPFLPRNVSLPPYVNYFKIAIAHTIGRWLFEKNIVFAALGLAPLAWTYLFFAPRLPRGFLGFLATTVVCVVIAAVLAAKEGSGPHHLLPFLPSLSWAFMVMRGRARSELADEAGRGRFEAATLGLMAAFIIGYGPILALSWGRVVQQLADTVAVRIAIDEIDKALDGNPGLRIAVGPGPVAEVDVARLRVIPVFRGNPLPIDTTTWMDLEAAGISDEAVKKLFRECRVDLWLLPTGPQLVMQSYYDTGRNLFSRAVIEDFQANYRKDWTGQIFDQWRCSHRG